MSAFLQIHFAQTAATPVIRMSGLASLDGVDVHDGADAPLVSFKQMVVNLNDVEPLGGVIHLGANQLDVTGLAAELVRNRVMGRRI